MYFVISANSESSATQILDVAMTREDAFLAMYGIFKAAVEQEGDGPAVPAVEEIGGGWGCARNGSLFCISPEEMVIDRNGTRQWVSIASYDIPLWRLDEETQESPYGAAHSTRIFLGKKRALDEMHKCGRGFADKLPEKRGVADVRSRGRRLFVDIDFGRGNWEISPVEIN